MCSVIKDRGPGGSACGREAEPECLCSLPSYLPGLAKEAPETCHSTDKDRSKLRFRNFFWDLPRQKEVFNWFSILRQPEVFN